MSRKKIYIIIAIVIVVLVVIALLKGGKGNKVKVTAEKAQKRTITQTVTASGTVQPASLVSITSNVSGSIMKIFVNTGQKVKKGQLLVKIDPKNYKSAEQQAEAALNAAKANQAQAQAKYIQAQLNYNRNKGLHTKGAISDADWETAVSQFQIAKADVNAAKFNVESAKATLKGAMDDLSKTTIYSPMDGIVSTIDKTEGENVVGTNMMSGTQIMSIANKSAILVYVDVNENDIIQVKKMDTAVISIDAFTNHKFKGLVSQIANNIESATATTASSDNQVKNYQVIIQLLPNSYKSLIKDTSKVESPFKTGMSAYAEIITKVNKNVLSVPIQAVTTRNDSTKSGSSANEQDIECVFVDSSGFAKQANVKTGIQDTKYIQIKSGIKSGAKIITGPYTVVSQRLEKGTQVKEVKEAALFKEDN